MTLDQVATTMVQEAGVIPEPLSKEQLKKLVVDAIKATTYHETLESYHALYGHMDRGIHTSDVIHGLQRDWKFERNPHFDRDNWQWKYYIDTETVDGDATTIVIAVDSLRKEFRTVTRWRED